MKNINIVLFLFIVLQINSQTIESFSLDSCGTMVSSGNISMVFSVGEVVYQERNLNEIHISEGFINGDSFQRNNLENQEILVKVYPNPTKNILFIESEVIFDAVFITNYYGNVLLQTNLINNQISIGGLKKGVYYLKLEKNGVIMTRKIIKN